VCHGSNFHISRSLSTTPLHCRPSWQHWIAGCAWTAAAWNHQRWKPHRHLLWRIQQFRRPGICWGYSSKYIASIADSPITVTAERLDLQRFTESYMWLVDLAFAIATAVSAVVGPRCKITLVSCLNRMAAIFFICISCHYNEIIDSEAETLTLVWW